MHKGTAHRPCPAAPAAVPQGRVPAAPAPPGLLPAPGAPSLPLLVRWLLPAAPAAALPGVMTRLVRPVNGAKEGQVHA